MDFINEYAAKTFVFLAMVLSLGLHEAAHAKSSRYFGDTTHAEDGEDTWNPIPHLFRSLFTSVIMPAIAWFFSGIFIGGASPIVNPDKMKYQRTGYALSVAAGPAMNLLLSFLMLFFALASGLLLGQKAAVIIPLLLTVGKFNLLLCIFNLLPVPPFDGSAVLQQAFPRLKDVIQFAGRFVFLTLVLLLLLHRPSAELLLYPANRYYDLTSTFIESVTSVKL